MNLIPPPPPEFRPSGGASCLRHPGQNPTGLCAPCLRERLSLLNPSPSPATSHSTQSVDGRKIRRCNTFSGNICESTVGAACEPRRNSCHVRVRPSLWALFNMEDEGRSSAAARNCVVEIKDPRRLMGGTRPVLQLAGDGTCVGAVDDDEIRVVPGELRAFAEESIVGSLNAAERFEVRSRAQAQRTIKEFIDLESKRSAKPPFRRDFKEIAGSFWIAASVFSEKLRKWKRKRSSGERSGRYRLNGVGLPEMGLKGIRLRETQSEAGEYWFGSRSTDTDPRYSIDLARASVDVLGRRSWESDSRFSVDGRTSFRDPGGGISSHKLDAPRHSLDRGSTSFRVLVERLGRTSSSSSGCWMDPGRVSLDGSATTSLSELGPARCWSDHRGKGSFRDVGGCCFDREVERNWSGRYSQSNQVDAGLLRFNLPPWKAYKKRSSAEKRGFNRSSSAARAILKSY